MRPVEMLTAVLEYWRPARPWTREQQDYVVKGLSAYESGDLVQGLSHLKAHDNGHPPTPGQIIATVDSFAVRRREAQQQRQTLESMRRMGEALSSGSGQDDMSSRCVRLFQSLAARSITRRQFLREMDAAGIPSGEMRQWYEWRGLDLEGLCGSRAHVAEEVGE